MIYVKSVVVIVCLLMVIGCASGVPDRSPKLELLNTVNASCNLEKVEMTDTNIRIRCFKPEQEEQF